MEKINFQDLPNTDTPIKANTLNKMQFNIEESCVAVSPTQPETNEKVWIDNENNIIKTKNNDGTFKTIYDEKNFLPNSYDEAHLQENLHFYKLDKMVFVNGLYPINAASSSFEVPYKPLLPVRFPVTSATNTGAVSSVVGIGIINQDGICGINMTGAVTYAYMSFSYKTSD